MILSSISCFNIFSRRCATASINARKRKRKYKKKSITRAERREKLAEYYEAGSKVNLIGCSDLPSVENVGFAEKRLQHDGKAIVTIYPAMNFQRRPKLMLNWTSDEDFDPTFKFKPAKENLTLKPETQAFLRGRPSVTRCNNLNIWVQNY